jgi:hypothetical protein
MLGMVRVEDRMRQDGVAGAAATRAGSGRLADLFVEAVEVGVDAGDQLDQPG